MVLMASISNLVFTVRDCHSPLNTVIAVPMINPAASWWLLSIKAEAITDLFWEQVI